MMSGSAILMTVRWHLGGGQENFVERVFNPEVFISPRDRRSQHLIT